MKIIKTLVQLYLGACLIFLVPAIAIADESASDAAQANNPLASMTAFNLHNYYIGKNHRIGRGCQSVLDALCHAV